MWLARGSTNWKCPPPLGNGKRGHESEDFSVDLPESKGRTGPGVRFPDETPPWPQAPPDSVPGASGRDESNCQVVSDPGLDPSCNHYVPKAIILRSDAAPADDENV
jgi:hypothetical protein